MPLSASPLRALLETASDLGLVPFLVLLLRSRCQFSGEQFETQAPVLRLWVLFDSHLSSQCNQRRTRDLIARETAIG